MKTNVAFGDTSAIVPLCIFQETSLQARQIQRAFPKSVVSWETLVEAFSAFNRALRKGALTQAKYGLASKQILALQKSWFEVPPDSLVKSQAVELLESYPLRTGDALQLAAAMMRCKGKPRHRAFVCFDLLLAEVATQVGFTVVGLQ
ncbi:MAG: type II toxin-antitoxin system VapC family toxin [Acidobacteria bacterium]|nr:type II toxin-antitoxin system VapC family toxin [Acidobacteriota bacterium]